jgi:hypothetical protein
VYTVHLITTPNTLTELLMVGGTRNMCHQSQYAVIIQMLQREVIAYNKWLLYLRGFSENQHLKCARDRVFFLPLLTSCQTCAPSYNCTKGLGKRFKNLGIQSKQIWLCLEQSTTNWPGWKGHWEPPWMVTTCCYSTLIYIQKHYHPNWSLLPNSIVIISQFLLFEDWSWEVSYVFHRAKWMEPP